MICCYQETKVFCSRYCIASSRDLIPRIFNHTIWGISSSNSISGIPGRKLPGKARSCIVESCGSCLTPSLCSGILLVSIGVNLQEDDAKFFEFSKNAEDGSLQAGRPSKTCPDVPNESRVLGCKQESRLIIPLDWERGIIQSCSQFPEHRILLHH